MDTSTFNQLIEAYSECKKIKSRNYVYASWTNQPKNFDGKTLMKILESRLKVAEAGMCDFISQTLNNSAIQSIIGTIS